VSEVTLIAHDVDSVGGMERVLSELVLGLVARGDKVTIIARRCTIDGNESIRFHRVHAPSRPFVVAYPWFAVAGWLMMRRYARGIVQSTGAIVPCAVDVVAVHFCHESYARSGRLVRRSRESLLHRANSRVAPILSRLGERWCLSPRRVRSVVGVSTGVADEVKQSYPGVATRVCVIPNGVNADEFTPYGEPISREELGVPVNCPLALFVGSEWRGKGLSVAIEALDEAPHWHLGVVGRGDEPRYQRLAARRGVAGRVHFLGQRRALPEIYRAADAFVLPSTYETFSLVTYEAAASGLPLLATRVSGVSDLLSDGVNGYLIRDDPSDLAKRLRELGDNPLQREQFGRAARDASLHFSWTAMVEAHRDLYRRLEAGLE
jgi:glycosyltransferase involved in cell wall biosynthesis